MHTPDPLLVRYLAAPGPHRLEIGAGANAKPGWIATDINPGQGPADRPVIALDATRDFAIPSDVFDIVYSEHVIEHITFDDGRTMLEECYRVLKPGGMIRIITPSLGFLSRILSSDRSPLEDRYREWSVRSFLPTAPAVTNAFFLNNFVRAWYHTFIYDRETLALSLSLAGFQDIAARDLNASSNPLLAGLENENRLPPGFLDLESMVMEARKPDGTAMPARTGVLLSRGKPARQSSVSPWSRGGTMEEDAGRVVSGTLMPDYNNHTSRDSGAWWQVDLEAIHDIKQVRIYNRTDTREIMARTSRFELQSSADGTNWQTLARKDTDSVIRGTPLAHFVWSADRPTPGRYIRVRLLGEQFLHLNQVEVLGV